MKTRDKKNMVIGYTSVENLNFIQKFIYEQSGGYMIIGTSAV